MFLFESTIERLSRLKSQAANLLTILNMAFGGAAILVTMNDHFALAVLFIFIAGLLDRFDGMTARKLGIESELGKQLDSMSDVISFGIAPALLIYAYATNELGTLAMVVTVIYIASGAFRLARFNISESNGFFTGLPITAAGVVLTLSYFAVPYVSPVVYLFFMIILSFMMISTLSLRKI
ncbi:CDP-diacylglycerol--serine O-phosphatidyltransferase [Chryseomicrobium aureum]|uniref:CDP-diacylglycerol--serine O-phosphatidyltransferase n=1 Tax=Chryseomicrobium aureum TaxID=1441723 RepID=UPI00195CFC3A|nr:CDP-diacylglycerol--serine O-phosphatidyltransferase [Chryseomicrobium aureum]